MKATAFVLSLAAALALSAAADAANREDGRYAAGEMSPWPAEVDTIRLQSAAGHASVNCVVVIGADGVYAAATEGVIRELIRTRLPEFVPIIGPLFEKGPRVRDFTAANRVGGVYLSGRTLVVRSEGAVGADTGGASPQSALAALCGPGGGARSVPIANAAGQRVDALAVVVANRQHAFLIQAGSFRAGGPDLSSLPFGTPALPEVGHAHAEGAELMIVVSPSILE